MTAEPRRAEDLSLPSPGVTIGPALVRRFGSFAGRLAAAREREEVGRRRALQGEGEEFVGHRPYRVGDDLRHLDWTLLARRGDRPFVRVHRSSASERWLVALDPSASMGIGRPGKLQSAAEAAGAAMALGLRLGSSITLLVPGDGQEFVGLLPAPVPRGWEFGARAGPPLGDCRPVGGIGGIGTRGPLHLRTHGPRARAPAFADEE